MLIFGDLGANRNACGEIEELIGWRVLGVGYVLMLGKN